MNHKTFQKVLDQRIARYGLLDHPFYKAWCEGKLSREHLRAYANEYFHHAPPSPHFSAPCTRVWATVPSAGRFFVILQKKKWRAALPARCGWILPRGSGFVPNRSAAANPGPPCAASSIASAAARPRTLLPRWLPLCTPTNRKCRSSVERRRVVWCATTAPMRAPVDTLRSTRTRMFAAPKAGVTNCYTLLPTTGISPSQL